MLFDPRSTVLVTSPVRRDRWNRSDSSCNRRKTSSVSRAYRLLPDALEDDVAHVVERDRGEAPGDIGQHQRQRERQGRVRSSPTSCRSPCRKPRAAPARPPWRALRTAPTARCAGAGRAVQRARDRAGSGGLSSSLPGQLSSSAVLGLSPLAPDGTRGENRQCPRIAISQRLSVLAIGSRLFTSRGRSNRMRCRGKSIATRRNSLS